jgi:Lon protease-like protein
MPGQPLSLHVFEERYRLLMSELLTTPTPVPRRFGVVAIRRGFEVGTDRLPDLYDVGCTAQLRQVREHDDGRFDVVTTGGTRFRVVTVETTRPYLVGHVELLAEPAGDSASVLASLVGAALGAYVDALADVRGTGPRSRELMPALPTDPVELSYAVAAAMALDLPERQGLLAAADAAHRLAAERRLLRRETALLRLLKAVPSAGLLPNPTRSPN